MSGGDPVISVVVPTFNRRDRLHRVLGSLARQEIDSAFEVVVVSDGSTDDTDDYLASDEVPLPIVALAQQNAGPAAARNRGVESCRADLILFLDDDVVADRFLLRTHLEAHARSVDDLVVIGPMIDPPDHQMTSWVAWEQQMLAKQYEAMEGGRYSATARQFYTGNASLLRKHFDAVGGFDDRFRRAEDVELAFRLDDRGLVFHYAPNAIGLHYAERSFDAWIDTARLYGHNDVVFARDLGYRFIYGQMHNSYRSRPIGLRVLTRAALASRRFDRLVTSLLAAMVQPQPRGRRRKIVRYALSTQYCLEYYRGVSDEMGSSGVFRRLMVRGIVPPELP